MSAFPMSDFNVMQIFVSETLVNVERPGTGMGFFYPAGRKLEVAVLSFPYSTYLYPTFNDYTGKLLVRSL